MPIVDQIPTPAGDIIVLRFGQSGAGPRVYLQGALHADEVSATLALHYLGNLLTTAEGEDRLRGEVILAPHCNPAGLNQFSLGRHLGRFDVADGRNFNRAFPDIAGKIIARLSRMGAKHMDAKTAIEIGAEILAQAGSDNPGDQFRLALMRLSWGADIVIDVHADMEAAVHMYSSAASWPQLRGLAERLAAKAVILCDISADRPFDEAHSHSWSQVERFLIGQGVEPERGVASCTVELRGLADVTPRLAEADAAAFYDYLVSMGVVAPAENHAPISCTPVSPTSLQAVEMVTTPRTGVCVHCKDVGDQVSRGGRSGAGLRSDGSRSRSGMGVVESNQ